MEPANETWMLKKNGKLYIRVELYLVGLAALMVYFLIFRKSN